MSRNGADGHPPPRPPPAFDVAIPGGTRFGGFALFASSRVRSCANCELARRAEGKKRRKAHAAYFAAAIIA